MFTSLEAKRLEFKPISALSTAVRYISGLGAFQPLDDLRSFGFQFSVPESDERLSGLMIERDVLFLEPALPQSTQMNI